MKINKPTGSLRGKEAEGWMEELWDGLINKLVVSCSHAEIKKILECLMSVHEKKVILRRLGVMAFARTGKSYRETSEALWLSPNTISTIRKNILGNRAGYKSYRKFYGGPRVYSGEVRIQKSYWEELLGDVDLWDMLIHPPRPGGIGILGGSDLSGHSRSYGRKRKN